MIVERKVHYSSLFTNLVGWHASAVSFPLSDIILAQLACPLSDITFCLHSGITNLTLYKHCYKLNYFCPCVKNALAMSCLSGIWFLSPPIYSRNYSCGSYFGATTLSLMTLSIMTFIMTLSLKGFCVTLSISDSQDKPHST
jgi:hypothetical protein